MKPSWGWLSTWIAVVCLLCSLGLQASMSPARDSEKHSLARLTDSPSPSPSLRILTLSGGWTRCRAGPHNFFSIPDVLFSAEDPDPAGPPWLESRGPPGKPRDPGPCVGGAAAKDAPRTHTDRVSCPADPIFPPPAAQNSKIEVLHHALASVSHLSPQSACCDKILAEDRNAACQRKQDNACYAGSSF